MQQGATSAACGEMGIKVRASACAPALGAWQRGMFELWWRGVILAGFVWVGQTTHSIKGKTSVLHASSMGSRACMTCMRSP